MKPTQIKEEVQNKQAVLLDVREKSEWEEGHISDAKHIPLGSLNKESISDLPKDIPIYVYCKLGIRAGKAEALLKENGFENAQNIGGVVSWVENGGELVKGD